MYCVILVHHHHIDLINIIMMYDSHFYQNMIYYTHDHLDI